MENAFLLPLASEEFNDLVLKNRVKSNKLLSQIGQISYPLFPGKTIRVIICNYDCFERMFIDKVQVSVKDYFF
jgi:hypothetical protein